MNRWWLVAVAAGLVCMALGPPAGAAAEQDAGQSFVLTGPVAVPLEEVPAFGKEEVSGRVSYRYPRGQSAGCVPSPSGEVKAYPTLKSKRPLYGSVKFDGSPYDAAIGTTYHFVLDETGEAEKKPEAGGGPGDSKPPTDAPKPAGDAQASKPSLLKELAKNLTATPRPADPFAREVRQVIKQTYDLLYFDRNGDLDLTNDGVVRLTDKPLFEAMPPGQMRGLSGEIEVTFDFGPPVGKRPFPIAVAVYAYQGANAPFSFQNVAGFARSRWWHSNRSGQFRSQDRTAWHHQAGRGAVCGFVKPSDDDHGAVRQTLHAVGSDASGSSRGPDALAVRFSGPDPLGRRSARVRLHHAVGR